MAKHHSSRGGLTFETLPPLAYAYGVKCLVLSLKKISF